MCHRQFNECDSYEFLLSSNLVFTKSKHASTVLIFFLSIFLPRNSFESSIYELEDKQLNSDGFNWLHGDDEETWAGTALIKFSGCSHGHVL